MNIQTELNSLQSELTDLQDQLKSAAPGEKPGLAAQIKKLNPQITAKQKELSNCAATHGGLPDADTTFSALAIMTTDNPKIAGPFNKNVTISAYFVKWLHDQVRITSFPTIPVGPFPTPVGDNTTTVTMTGGGFGPVDRATGKVEITLKLHFHHSLALAKDSDMTITLSTEGSGGSRIDSGGNATLVGKAKFDGGYLDGNTCTLSVKGKFSTKP